MKKNNDLKSITLFNIIIFVLFIIISNVFFTLNNENALSLNAIDVRFFITLVIQGLVVLALSNIVFLYFRKLKHDRILQLDDVPIVICIWGLSGKLSYVNKETLDIFEINKDEFDKAEINISDLSIYDYLHEKDVPRATENVKNLILQSQRVAKPVDVSEYTFVSQSGKELQFLTYTRRFSINSFITFAIDHTVLKRKDSQLEERREFLSLLVEGLPQPMIYLDKNFKVKFVSKLFEQQFSVTFDEVKMEPQKFNARNIKKNIKIMKECMEESSRKSFDDIVTVKGKRHFIHFDAVPDSTKNPNGIFLFLHDTTPEILIKKRLELSNKLNKSLFDISEMLINIVNEKYVEILCEKIFKNIANTLDVDRAYFLKFNGDKLFVQGGYDKEFVSLYKNKTIKLGTDHIEYYEKRLNPENKLIDSSFENSPHSKLFGLQSCLDIYNGDVIVGVGKMKNRTFRDVEEKYLQSAAYLIIESKKRIEQYRELDEQRETLNTLVDNTDLGVIISGVDNIVYYTNKNAENIFNVKEDDWFMIENYAADEDEKRRIQTLIKEELGKHSFTIKMKNGIYIKLYSSMIDYNDSKAYLTTITDVTEYIK